MRKIKNEAIEAMRKSLDNPNKVDPNQKGEGGDLNKAGITQSLGLNAYDLRSPALEHIPFLTPVRDMLPRTARNAPGIALNWKVLTGIVGSGVSNIAIVPEGGRSATKNIKTTDASAKYVTMGEEGFTTDEAVRGSKGFMDVEARDRVLTMESLWLKEESTLLGGSRNLRLGTPSALTTTVAANNPSSSPIAGGNYYVCAVGLTFEGMGNSSVAGGLIQNVTVNGNDRKNFSINGGSSNRSPISSAQAVSNGQSLVAYVPNVQGAMGYAWYVGTTGAPNNMYLQAITTVNYLRLDTFVTGTRQTADYITADCSYNDGSGNGPNPVASFDGLATAALIPGNNAYFYSMPCSAAGGPTSLTPDGAGGIVEIKNMFKGMWNATRSSVDHLMMSANTADAIYTKILNNNSAPLLHINKDANSDAIELKAGGSINAYFSPIGNPYGGMKAQIMVHPNLPDGVILGWATTLPSWYWPAPVEVVRR
ncbi:hypothetical protein [Roseicella sp. DB1501]|uniref:hypothetical protein n=1 Tax=Roseicella sp. DB1501 TaxID=2730925 RepID=UPI001490ABF0|nr:hypothetical protein [Roseicella sp. DB1501]NOG73767.1 hypothetical protein [Roseicella sp. DB1501]